MVGKESIDVSSVAQAFNASDAGSNVTASTYSVLMYTTILGLYLLMSIYIVVASIRDGDTVEERQFNFIRTVGIFTITFILILLFIGIATVAT